MYLGHVKVLLGMFLSLKTLYRKRTVIWPFYFYTIIRTLSSFLNTDGGFPIGTLIANLTGAFVMGLLTALTIAFFSNHPTLKKAITTGFLGALTTFSTFQLELIHMFDHQQFITLLLYAVTSYVFGILLCYVGIKLGGGLS
ncbi:CrcB family protein [Staphylococcus aureus]|nr:CrcB family protein [Staphylococcus aureus]